MVIISLSNVGIKATTHIGFNLQSNLPISSLGIVNSIFAMDSMPYQTVGHSLN